MTAQIGTELIFGASGTAGKMLPGSSRAGRSSRRSVWAANAPWKTATIDVVREFLGEERRAGAGTYRAPTHDYADDLVRAGYRSVVRQSVPVRRTHTVESVIGYLHSTSFASLAVLGDRTGAFDDQLPEQLAPFVDADGLLVDDNEFDILTAHR